MTRWAASCLYSHPAEIAHAWAHPAPPALVHELSPCRSSRQRSVALPPSPSIHPEQPWGGGRLRPREQQQDEVPVWEGALVLLLPSGLRSCLSLSLQSYFFLPVIYCCSAESHQDTVGADIKQARLPHTCRQLQHYSLKPESKGRWQWERDKGEKSSCYLKCDFSNSKESF